MTLLTLIDQLAQLEQEDPAVAAAAASFDRMVEDLNDRAALHTFRPLPWDRIAVAPDIPVVADRGGSS